MSLPGRISLSLLFALSPMTSATAQPEQSAPAAVESQPEFPQRREIEGHALLLHAPQIRSWPEFANFTGEFAFELTPPGASKPLLGTARLVGATAVDLPRRLVVVRSPVVDQVKFADPTASVDPVILQRAVRRQTLDVPLDLFLAHLADDVLAGSAPTGFNTDPPPILVRSSPTILLFVNGQPVPAPIPGTKLELIVNSNWPLLRDTATGGHYLLERDRWLTSTAMERGWRAASSLPAGFNQLPATEEYAALRAALPLKPSSRPLPGVDFANKPTELIVTDGAPALEPIKGAEGLQWVRNTESPLFKLGANYYFLVAGRWFSASNLDTGPWTFVKELPPPFTEIPETHAMAAVRASVPGTVESKMAALEAQLPTIKSIRKGAPPPVAPTFAGEPKFEAIPGTPVARASNTGFDVLMYGNRFYLCYAAAWYVADSANGPWAATDQVPAAIYAIPPSSPSYAVTDVKVAKAIDDTIEYSSTAAYATGMYVAFGVAYYGTGWYYPPYYSYPYYYPYGGAYGHGSWYNPATGGYGSRSVWAGPYGGYSYNQAYNPRTGRYGYVETAWDGDEWASYGETYNPRTGVSTETERYYNEDKNKLTTERTVERGDQSMTTERTRDFDEGKSTIERETSGGGSSQTVRQDGQSATQIQGAGGGQAVSVSGEGSGRTTIAQSGSGDLYAGHDGNVYKKTDDGWQQYQGGSWAPTDVAQRATTTGSGAAVQQPARQPTAQPSTRPSAQPSTRPSYDPMASSRGSSSLDRDYSARQRGASQFNQRAGGGGARPRRGR